MKPNERISPVVSPPQLRGAMEALPQALISLLGNSIVHATYGYGCHLHPELCYIAVKVGTSWLGRFIDESLQQRIVVPGESDFIFVAREGELEVEFCHEGHVHLSGTNQNLMSQLLAMPVFAFTSGTESSREPEA
jgi:hypothetical protein